MRATSAINACSTFALYIFIWSEIAFGRIPAACTQKLLSIFECICDRICGVVHHCPCTTAGLSPFPSFPHMRVGDGGRLVAGIWQAIEQLPQSAIANLRGAWRRLYNASKLAYASIEQDWLLLKDVMVFVALAQRSEYTPRKCEPEAIAFITDFKNEVLWWLAHLFDTYIREVYLPAHGGCDRPPGALSRDPSKRKYVQMHPEAVWEAIQEARDTGASLATVLAIRKKTTTQVPTRQAQVVLWPSTT